MGRVQVFVWAAVTLVSMSVAAVAQMAQPAQPGWIADSRTGCKVWDLSPQPKETITWTGACTNGLAQGRGVLQWFGDGKPIDRFEGEYRDGKENGHGVYTWADGSRFEGGYRDNKKNGRGVFTWANGDRYDGEWRDGNENGHGVYTWANGDRYDGEWRDDNANGRGLKTWVNGDRYNGEWRDDKPNGLGQALLSNSSYNGVWTDGCFRDGSRRAAIGRDLSSCP